MDRIKVYREPNEYFNEQILHAVENLTFKPSENGKQYLLKLLCRFARVDSKRLLPHSDPLVIILADALSEARSQRFQMLKDLGDLALLICGFFPESLNRSLVDVQYYSDMGRRAYNTINTEFDFTVFDEMSREFMGFSDLISEIRSNTSLRPIASILLLYEKWLRTGSADSARRLLSKGIVPSASVRKMRIQ